MFFSCVLDTKFAISYLRACVYSFHEPKTGLDLDYGYYSGKNND